MRLSTWY